MRRKRYKGDKKGRYLALLTLTAVVITCFSYPYFYSVLLKRQFNPNTLIRVSDFKGDGGIDKSIAAYSDGLVSLRSKALRLQAENGDTLWERDIDIEEPYIAASEDMIVAADMKDSVIYWIDHEGEEVRRAVPAGDIVRMGISGEHVWVAARQKGDISLEVFDRGGNNVSYLQGGAAEITGVSISREGLFIAVATAGVEDAGIISRVTMYKSDGTILWAKGYDDSLIMGIKFVADDTLTVLTEKGLTSLDDRGNMRWQKAIEGYVTRALLTDKGISAVSLRDDYRSGVPGGGSGETVIYGEGGNELKRLKHTERIIGLADGPDCIGIYSGRRLNVVSLDGKKVQSKVFDSDLTAVYMLRDGYMAYISADKLYFEPFTR